MGAGQSTTSEPEEKVFSSSTPIQFDKDLVNHLSDKLTSPDAPDAARQATLDSHIQARIQVELERLREEEQLVRHEIETALEKENLDKEIELAKGDDGEAEVASTSTESLRSELEEVQKKAERFVSRKQMDDLPEVKEKQDALLKCYLSHPSTPLDCWREVEDFKHSVNSLEKKFVESLR